MQPETPFSSTHSPQLVLVTDAWRQSLTRLADGFGAREPFVLVTGEAGAGKTALVLHAVAEWGTRARAAVVTNPALTRVELLEEIALRFGAAPSAGASKPQLLACLGQVFAATAAQGRVPVVVIEDAHQLAPELLEELRLLANAEAQAQRPIEIVLVGLPALEERLAATEMASIRQRVAVHCRVAPLSAKETRNYIHHRVRAAGADGPGLFPRRTCAEIHERSGGIPRAINQLAAEVLRGAKGDGPSTIAPVAPPAAAVSLGEAGESMPPPEARQPHPVAAAAPSPVAPAPRAGSPPAAPVESDPRAGSPPAVPVESDPRAGSPPAAPVVFAPVASKRGRPAVHEDARVREWVTRFVGDQGPPRIGSALGAEFPVEADGGTGIRAGRGGRRGRVPAPEARTAEPVVTREAEAGEPELDVPVLRAAPSRRRSRRSWVTGPALPAAVFAAAALATVLVLLRAQRSSSRGASTVAAVAVRKTVPVAPPPAEDAARAASRDAGRAPGPVPSTVPAAPPRDRLQTAAADARPPSPPPAPLPSPTATRADAAAASREDGADAAVADVTPQRFALQVATYLAEERARSERDRLAAAVGLDAWVVRVAEHGGESFRVVLGVYRTAERAEEAAVTLLDRGVVSEARVVPLPPRSARR